jgi:multidrug efflux pump subunit AcrA (membrane-fusion protein)
MKHLLIILFSFSLLFFSCSSEKEIKPIVQDIKELVFASGTLEWDDAYNLTAQTDGVLTNADFDIGNKVLKGAILATIENPNNQINTQTAKEQLVISNENLTDKSPQLQQLEQNIAFAESKYEQDKLQVERYQRLYESQSIAKVELENVQLNAKNSLANLNALKKQTLQIKQQAKQQQITAKGQVENSKVFQNYNQIVVTENGTIIKKLKTNGDYVRKGEIIATLANEQKVEAVLNVDENSIEKVKLGQLVFVQLNTNKETIYEGKISEILSAFDEKTQSFICKVTFETTLKSSLFGTQLEANILVGQKQNALLVPRNYVGFGNKVNVKGKDKNVIIKTGIVSNEYIEILSGLDTTDVLLPLKL